MKKIYELQHDLPTIRALLKLFHPDCPELSDDKLLKMCGRSSYHWMTITERVKDYGQISLLISDMDDPTNTSGPGWTLEDFEKKAVKLQFDIWRSLLDKLPTNDLSVYENGEFTSAESYKLRPQYTEILKKAGYRTKTAKEWMTEYYSD